MEPGTVDRFKHSLLSVNRMGARAIIEGATGDTASVRVLEDLVSSALEQIGSEWERGSVSLAQLYMAGRICEDLIDKLVVSSSVGSGAPPRAAVTSLIDYHGLGKRMVYAAVRATGHDIADYGRTDVAQLVARVQAEKPEVLFVSVLMLSSALHIGDVCAALRSHGSSTRVVVGGAPFRFDANLWREVGAFAMGESAFDAVRFLPSSREVPS